MSREDILNTRYGQMIDLINCHMIYSGAANPAKESQRDHMDIMEALSLR